MSAYTTKIENKIDSVLAKFKNQITETETPSFNNQGYGYLSSGRKNIHRLNDGTYITEGLSFSPSKAATIGYCYHKDADGKTITDYKVN